MRDTVVLEPLELYLSNQGNNPPRSKTGSGNRPERGCRTSLPRAGLFTCLSDSLVDSPIGTKGLPGHRLPLAGPLSLADD